MVVTLSVPSKTFLIGEYLALQGGPSVIINTEPRFELKVKVDGQGNCRGIHRNSPAGQWMRQNSYQFKDMDIDFYDPHEGQGGFGASSSQFLLVYVWSMITESSLLTVSKQIHPEKVLEAYHSLEWKGVKPSGADVMAQLEGGICEFKNSSTFSLSSMLWPFSDLDILIARTGQKVTTHDHLAQLELEGMADSLRGIAETTVKAMRNSDPLKFIEGINEFQIKLKEHKCLHQHSRQLMDEINSWSDIKVVKACGALGADTLLMVFSKEVRTSLYPKILKLGLQPVANSLDLSKGLMVSYESLTQNVSNFLQDSKTV